MQLSRKLIRLALPTVVAAATLVFQSPGPAGATYGSAGAMTGWEDATAVGGCGFPQTGFEYSGATLVFRDVLNGTTQVNDVEVSINAFLAAPQGVAPGGCQLGAPLAPMVPMPVTITQAKVGGTLCTLGTTVPNRYTRVNTTVAITFDCGTLGVWTLAGNQNICSDPFGIVTNPECASPDAAGYMDPVSGGSGSHFVVAYAHT